MFTKEKANDLIIKLASYAFNSENYTSLHQSKLKAFAMSGEHFPIEIKQNILFPLDIRKDPPKKPSNSAHNFFYETSISSRYLTPQVREVINFLNTFLSTYKGRRTEPLLCAAIYQIVIKINEASYSNLAEIDKRESEIETLKTWFQKIRSNPVKFSEDLKLLLIKIENTLNSMQTLLEKKKTELENVDLFDGFYELPTEIKDTIDLTIQYLTSLPNVYEAIYDTHNKKNPKSFPGFSATRLLKQMNPYSLEGRLLVSTNIGHSLLNIFDININKDNAVLLSFLKIENKSLIPLAESPQYISSPEGIGICPELWENNRYTQKAIIETISAVKNLSICGDYLEQIITEFKGGAGNIVLFYEKGKIHFLEHISQTSFNLEIIKSHILSIHDLVENLFLKSEKANFVMKNYSAWKANLEIVTQNYKALSEKHSRMSNAHFKKSLGNLQQNLNNSLFFSSNLLEPIEGAPRLALPEGSVRSTLSIEEIPQESLLTPKVILPITSPQTNLPSTTAQSSSPTVLTEEEKDLILNLGKLKPDINRYKEKAIKSLAHSEIKKFTAMEVYSNKKISEASKPNVVKVAKTGGAAAGGAAGGAAVGIVATIALGVSLPLWPFIAAGAGIAGIGYAIVSTPAEELENRGSWEKLGYILSNMIFDNNAYETAATTKSALELWSNQLTTTLGKIREILYDPQYADNIVANKQFVLTMLDAVISTDYHSFNKLAPGPEEQKLLHAEGKILRNLFFAVVNGRLEFSAIEGYMTKSCIYTDKQLPGSSPCPPYIFGSTESTASDAALEGFIQLVIGSQAGLDETKKLPSPQIANLTARQLRASGLQRSA